MKRWIQSGVVAFLAAAALAGATSAQAKVEGKLVIFHAGSLSVPFAAMEKAFEAKYPGVDVQREAGGSTKMARLIAEVGKPADIMASADYAVIDKVLIPKKKASWNIRFATNQLVLCYTDQSRFAAEVSADNWTDILLKKDVVWGHSDPNLDPCGYRSLMVMQLAEGAYGKAGLYDALVAKRKQEWVRPKSVELVSLLKTGNMDYAWEYRSVAVQHGLKFISMPAEINLGDYRHDAGYAKAKVEVSGNKPGAKMTLKGKSITYGITMTDDAANPEAAVAFMAYLFAPDGGAKILKEQGQPPFVPARVPDAAMQAKLPEALKTLVEVKN